MSSWNDFGHFRPKHSRDDIVSQSTMSSRQNYNHTIFLTAVSQSLALSVSNMVHTKYSLISIGVFLSQ